MTQWRAAFSSPMAAPMRKSPPRQRIRLDRIVWSLIAIMGAFYGGMLVGIHSQSSSLVSITHSAKFEQAVKSKVQAVLQKRRQIDQENNHNIDFAESRFGGATAHFALGAARVEKQDFLDAFDSGLPEDPYKQLDPAASEVMMLYNNQNSLPNLRRDEVLSSSGVPPKVTAIDATQNCQILHVVSTNSALPQCIAIVPQYESYHIQRWMRIEPYTKLNKELPLAPVGRGQQTNGVNWFEPPDDKAAQVNQQYLRMYLEHSASAIEKLKLVLERVAVNNSVVVMVCNMGQADLLTNFACSNKAKGLSLGHVIVFCTDQETCDIATELGMATYYDEEMFGSIPKSHAHEYGDEIFQQLMFIKAISIQLVNWLGYNILFQDVDIVWFKNPLELFPTLYSDFDVLFQDDGARSIRYAPYCANSGFYFVRYNEKTRHLLTRMLYAGDTIVTSGSHQQALNALIAEHASLYGLRVKILPGHEFPGGAQFHRDKEFMHKLLLSNTFEPCIMFHMSWTNNKDHKINFMQQMGMWYVKDNSRLGIDSCSAKPIVKCHFKDKPSVQPCPDSPLMDKNGHSFWPEHQS